MKEIEMKFNEYYKHISNDLNDKVFSGNDVAKEIVKMLFCESKTKRLNIKEMLTILDIAKDMVLKHYTFFT
jgi:hypothetical protein